MGNMKWLVIVGGVVAAIGQFWGGPGSTTNLYLPLIGGAAAVIGALVE